MFQVLIELCPASSHMFPIHSFARYFLYYFFLNMIFMFASFDKKKIQQIRHAMLYRDWKLFCCHDYFWVGEKTFVSVVFILLLRECECVILLFFWYKTKGKKKEQKGDFDVHFLSTRV